LVLVGIEMAFPLRTGTPDVGSGQIGIGGSLPIGSASGAVLLPAGIAANPSLK
jgi:hypothetical protein